MMGVIQIGDLSMARVGNASVMEGVQRLLDQALVVSSGFVLANLEKILALIFSSLETCGILRVSNGFIRSFAFIRYF